MRVNEMVVDDTTKVIVRRKSGSQVKRARDVTSKRETDLTLERRAVFCNVNGGGGAKAAPPCISGTDWNFLMRFSPNCRESQAH